MRIKSIDTLYHGSDKEFEKIDLRYANAFKDYGKVFYLTSSYQQAQNGHSKKARIGQLHISIVTALIMSHFVKGSGKFWCY